LAGFAFASPAFFVLQQNRIKLLIDANMLLAWCEKAVFSFIEVA